MQAAHGWFPGACHTFQRRGRGHRGKATDPVLGLLGMPHICVSYTNMRLQTQGANASALLSAVVRLPQEVGPVASALGALLRDDMVLTAEHLHDIPYHLYQ